MARRVVARSLRLSAPRLLEPEPPGVRARRDARLPVRLTVLLVLAVPTGLAALEALLSRDPAAHFWTWSLSSLLAAFTALLCGLAARRAEPPLASSWWALAAGAATMALALLGRGPRGLSDPASAGLAGEMAMLAPVPPFLLAALLRLGGHSVAARRLKLLLDVLILGLSPALAGLVLVEWMAPPPGVGPAHQLIASIYAVSYTALGFGVLVAVRGKRLPRALSPAGLLLAGVGLLWLAALLSSARLLGLAPFATGIGQSFWGVGIGLVGLAGLRQARAADPTATDETQSYVRDESRLRLLPSALAGLVVLLIVVVEAFRSEPPLESVFLGSLTLLSLLIGRQMVTLLENRRLLRRDESAGEAEERLRDLGRALSATLELSTVLRELCRAGHEIMRADVVFLWSVDASREALEVVEVVGAHGAEFRGRRVRLAEPASTVAQAFRARSPEIVHSSRASRLGDQPLTTMLGAHSQLVVPLAKGNKVIGVLQFIRRRADDGFTERDRIKAEVLVSQAMFAIENAQLYTRQRQRLDELAALYDFTRGVSNAQTPATIADHLLETLKQQPGYARARVLLRDPETKLLRLAASDGDTGSLWAESATPSDLARRAIARGEPMRSETLHTRPRPRLAVPLVLQDRVIGVVELEGAPGTRYVAAEESLVVSLANQAALAIDNLHLVEEARKVETLREMDRVKRDLLSTVSHELRTPLSAIKGSVSTLLNFDARLKREQRREFLEMIQDESNHLAELIENLLDMSRLEAGVLRVEQRRVELEPVALQALNRVSTLTDRHKLVLDWCLREPVYADPRRVTQIISNLLENAVKYSPDGGEIVLRAERQGSEAVISVTDHGVGIPPWQLERVFERFHRVDGELARRVGGTGLGLAICKGLVEAHGGRIWVTSELHRGSTFFFTLPIHTGREAAFV